MDRNKRKENASGMTTKETATMFLLFIACVIVAGLCLMGFGFAYAFLLVRL